MISLVRILMLLPMIVGLLQIDAPSGMAGCSHDAPAAHAPAKEKSCCAVMHASAEGDTIRPVAVHDAEHCCCRAGLKPSCGCECGNSDQDKAPPSRAPATARVSVAKCITLEIACTLAGGDDEHLPSAGALLTGQAAGPARHVLLCRWRN